MNKKGIQGLYVLWLIMSAVGYGWAASVMLKVPVEAADNPVGAGLFVAGAWTLGVMVIWAIINEVESELENKEKGEQ
jgi:hypothetical protein